MGGQSHTLLQPYLVWCLQERGWWSDFGCLGLRTEGWLKCFVYSRVHQGMGRTWVDLDVTFLVGLGWVELIKLHWLDAGPCPWFLVLQRDELRLALAVSVCVANGWTKKALGYHGDGTLSHSLSLFLCSSLQRIVDQQCQEPSGLDWLAVVHLINKKQQQKPNKSSTTNRCAASEKSKSSWKIRWSSGWSRLSH